MKKNIEKHFLLLIFIFAISLVNITSTFALGKTADILPSVKKFITKGVDTEACKKKDITKAGLAQYSEACRKQCTSKDAKYTKFKADNKEDCEFLVGAGGTSGTGGTGTPDAAAQPAVGGTGGGTGTPDAAAQPAVGGTGGGTGTPDAAAQPAVGGTGGDTGDVEAKKAQILKEKQAKKAQLKEEQAKQAQILLEEEIKNADLSTKEAFDKIKEVLDVTVARLDYSDENEFFQIIGYLGLVPVRVTITPKAVNLDRTKQALLEKLLTQRILALAAETPTTLGKDANEHADPAPGSLYELIYKGAVDGLDKIVIAHINTGVRTEKDLIKYSTVGAIVNTAKVIAARKSPDPDTAIDILLELDAPGYVSGFEKLSGVTFSYAHIADPAATGAAFVAPENFAKGLAPDTEANTVCPVEDTLFVDRLKAHPGCKNLLKITVPTPTTAEFGIADVPSLVSGDSAAHIQAAAQAAKTVGAIIDLLALNLGFMLVPFATYFDPTLAETDDDDRYASQAIRDQLKSSSSSVITNFTEEFRPSHYWPASEHVQAALVTLPAQDPDPAQVAEQKNTIFLFRVAGDLKSVYLTKKINAPAPDPAPEASGGGAGTGGTGSADVKQP